MCNTPHINVTHDVSGTYAVPIRTMFPFSLPWFSSSTKRYRKTASFSSAGCFSLALSHNGENLAVGGAQGIKLLNILTQKELTVPSHVDSRGVVTCATWMKTRYTLSETLCYGTSLGYIVFLRTHPADQKQFHEICARRLGSGFEITCITWDSASAESTCQIALGTRDNIVQVLVLGANSQLQSVFAGRLDSTVPRSIAFGDTGSIYVFGLYDGNVIKLSSKDGTVLSEHRCQSVMWARVHHHSAMLTSMSEVQQPYTSKGVSLLWTMRPTDSRCII